MRRRNKPEELPEKADLICTSDWHLRDTVPSCRTDDFWESQWKKVDYVAELSERYNCPIFHGGDLLHHWRASPYLLYTAIQHLPKDFRTILGNHDLPQHSLELREKGGVDTLAAAGAVTILDSAHNGLDPQPEHTIKFKGRKILVWHQGVWKGKPPWPGCTAWEAKEVLEEYPNYDLVITGDFHTPCVEELDGRILVNPGSLMRQTADQIDFRPRVYLWDAESNSVTPAYLPIDPDAVSREHLDKISDRDARIEAFVSRLDAEWKVDLNFESNVNRFIEQHREEIDAKTEEIVRKAVAV